MVADLRFTAPRSNASGCSLANTQCHSRSARWLRILCFPRSPRGSGLRSCGAVCSRRRSRGSRRVERSQQASCHGNRCSRSDRYCGGSRATDAVSQRFRCRLVDSPDSGEPGKGTWPSHIRHDRAPSTPPYGAADEDPRQLLALLANENGDGRVDLRAAILVQVALQPEDDTGSQTLLHRGCLFARVPARV